MISAIRNATYLGVKIHTDIEVAPRPIHLAFLMDVSDSMIGERLQTVKRTLHAARPLFNPTDRVTLVTFGNHGYVVTDHLLLDETGIQTFYAKVDAIGTAGCTNLSAGIEALLNVRIRQQPFDAIVVLTDGLVNNGITSTKGLQTMFAGFGSIPITAIGYGADHNRILLQNIALATRGSYVYVDSESLIPMAMGDLLSGIRREVLRGARLTVPQGWTSMELGTDSFIGNIVSNRDYWVVYKRVREAEDGPIVLTDAAGYHEELRVVAVSDCHDLQEQVLRCRVAKALASLSSVMEQSLRVVAATYNEISQLNDEFANLAEAMLARPLIVRMKAQIAEIMESHAHHSDEVLARMSSGVVYLSSQRGVTSGDQLFSSPCQRTASDRVQTQFENT
jgi:hypothetical protein